MSHSRMLPPHLGPSRAQQSPLSDNIPAVYLKQLKGDIRKKVGLQIRVQSGPGGLQGGSLAWHTNGHHHKNERQASRTYQSGHRLPSRAYRHSILKVDLLRLSLWQYIEAVSPLPCLSISHAIHKDAPAAGQVLLGSMASSTKHQGTATLNSSKSSVSSYHVSTIIGPASQASCWYTLQTMMPA